MEIVLVHGYFLKGTGSNLFVKNVCRELCEQGHHVMLFCQENHTEDIDFVNETFEFNPENNKMIKTQSKATAYAGKCSLCRPNLNGFLPVFVYDRYEGYEVKKYTDCTEEEIERYLTDNVNAINCAMKDRTPDLVWSNHTIMQPVYVARSNLLKGGCSHVLTVHGSCLNFAVRLSSMLQKYAWEAMESARQDRFCQRVFKKRISGVFQPRSHDLGKSGSDPRWRRSG